MPQSSSISGLSDKLSYVNVEYKIALKILQYFQYLLVPRMFPDRNFVVGVFTQKAKMGLVTLNPLSSQNLYNK